MHTLTATDSVADDFQRREFVFFRVLFVVGALWNLAGAILGYFNTADTYQAFFGRALTDSLDFAIYQGSWGTTLLYFVGYLFVAYRPDRHTGIVLLGTIGKLFFASKLLALYMTGLAQAVTLTVVIGDFVFSALFVYYLVRMVLLNKEL